MAAPKREGLLVVLNVAAVMMLMNVNLLSLGMWFENVPWRNWYVFATLTLDAIYGLAVVSLLGGIERAIQRAIDAEKGK
jgi:hypothetical protein